MRLIDADSLKCKFEKAQAKALKDDRLDLFGALVAIIRAVDEEPTVDAEPVRNGRWEKSPTGNGFFVYCSECGAAADVFLAHRYKGCPFCLCEIDGGAEENADN